MRGPKYNTATECPAEETKGPADKDVWRIHLSRRSKAAILALGAELKSTVCLYSEGEALISGVIGNLIEPRAYRRFAAIVDRFNRAPEGLPNLVAHDCHPQYLSTQHAAQLGIPTVGVQHHHAHVASVMAECHIEKPVVGVCCDGAGYGADGAIWGCEVLYCEFGRFERLGHLEYIPLVGGDAAAIETIRPAFALLAQAYGDRWRQNAPSAFDRVPVPDLVPFPRRFYDFCLA